MEDDNPQSLEFLIVSGEFFLSIARLEGGGGGGGGGCGEGTSGVRADILHYLFLGSSVFAFPPPPHRLHATFFLSLKIAQMSAVMIL